LLKIIYQKFNQLFFMSNTSDLTQGDVLKLQAELEEWKEVKQEEKAHKKNQTIAGVVLSNKKIGLHTQKEELTRKRDDIGNKITLLKNEKNEILSEAVQAKAKKIKSKLTTTFEEIEGELEDQEIGIKVKYIKHGKKIVERAKIYLLTEVPAAADSLDYTEKKQGENLLFMVTLDDDNLHTYLEGEQKEKLESLSAQLTPLQKEFDALNLEISVLAKNIHNFDLVKEKITAQIDYNALDEEDQQLVAELEKSLSENKLLLSTGE
jgi:prefoldin subunit 5